MKRKMFGYALTAMLLSVTACNEGIGITRIASPNDQPPQPQICMLPVQTVDQPANRTYLPMHSLNVPLGMSQVAGSSTEDLQVVEVELTITANVVQSPATPTPNAVVNYRLTDGKTAITNPQNIDPLTATPTTKLAYNPESLFILKNETLALGSLGDVNAWENILPTGWHTDLMNAGVTVTISRVTCRGTTSNTLVDAAITNPPVPKTFQIFRNTFGIASADTVPGGYTNQVLGTNIVPSGFAFASAGRDEVRLNTVQFNWEITGVALNDGVTNLPYTIYGTDPVACQSRIIATGNAVPIKKDATSYWGSSSHQISSLGTDPTAGFPLSGDGESSTIYFSFNTHAAFHAISGVPETFGTDLVYCTFTDGTHGITTPTACDPALFIAPIKGRVVTTN